MRILHLVQPWHASTGATPFAMSVGSDVAVLACANVLESTPGEHTVLLLSTAAGQRRAAALGLESDERLHMPMGNARLARGAFGDYARSRGPFDLVHAWGSGFWTLRPWRAATRGACMTTLSTGDTRLFPGSTWTGVSGVVRVPPPLLTRSAAERAVGERDILRRAMGIKPGMWAIALLADPPSEAHASRFASLLPLLESSGLPCVGVVPEHAIEFDRGFAKRRMAAIGSLPIVVRGPMVNVLAACDVAVVEPGSRFMQASPAASWTARGLVRIAHSLRVPVITASPGALGVDLAPDLLSPSPHPASIARTIARLLEDPARLRASREAVVRAAREEPDLPAAISDFYANAMDRSEEHASAGYADPEFAHP